MKSLIFGLLLIAAPAVAQPQIVPADVHVVASPNALTWPVTAHISSIEANADGMRVLFDKCGAWPEVTPPGWAGPLIYTLWLFQHIGVEWVGSGIIQFWACGQANGGPIYQDNQIAKNWVYGSQWAPMTGIQPKPGERIAFMVSAGNARMQDDHAVDERSAIVEVAMPSGPGNVPFLAVEGPSGPPPPPPVVSPDLTPRLETLEEAVALFRAQLMALEGRVTALEAKPIPATCKASIWGYVVSCKLQ